jgi:hypothetical protein
VGVVADAAMTIEAAEALEGSAAEVPVEEAQVEIFDAGMATHT